VAGGCGAAEHLSFYGNTYTCDAGSTCGDVVATRSGTGLAWGNTINRLSGASMNNFYVMQTYRALQNIADGEHVMGHRYGI